MSEFKSFGKIENIGKLMMTITQKMHGTNAQIKITKIDSVNYLVQVGSRTRWITPQDDNFGFATFVYANMGKFIQSLGEGTYFGEWCGPGINSGEGFKEKTFVLFNHRTFPPERPLPPNTIVVPVLYKGKLDMSAIESTMEALKTNGSVAVPGFMRPEGIVVDIGGRLYKKVFNPEETMWKQGSIKPTLNTKADVSHLLQPIRLEKLLSRDSRFMEQYPKNYMQIVYEYVADLNTEGFEVSKDEKKQITKQLKRMIDERG
jgi:RNA ligase